MDVDWAACLPSLRTAATCNPQVYQMHAAWNNNVQEQPESIDI